MKLNVLAFGIAAGLVLGLGILVATLVALFEGGGGHMFLLRNACPGYTVSGLGTLLGFLYLFVYGLIGGALVAGIYNLVSKAR